VLLLEGELFIYFMSRKYKFHDQDKIMNIILSYPFLITKIKNSALFINIGFNNYFCRSLLNIKESVVEFFLHRHQQAVQVRPYFFL
jgi:hypothetical protein